MECLLVSVQTHQELLLLPAMLYHTTCSNYNVNDKLHTVLLLYNYGFMLYTLSVQDFEVLVNAQTWIISVRQHICYNMLHAITSLSLRLSACLSITRVDQSKTVEVRIMQFSPQSSPTTLVSSWLTSTQNSKGNKGAGVPNRRGVRKICNFQPISCRISETVQDRTKVTTND